jgi:hypothetical protein
MATDTDSAVVIANDAGVTVTAGVVFGAAKVAVTMAFALIVTLQVSVDAVVHPDQEVNVSLPEVAGAVTVTAVPEL